MDRIMRLMPQMLKQQQMEEYDRTQGYRDNYTMHIVEKAVGNN